MRELGDLYETELLDCGLPQEDEVVQALMHALSAAKHKVFS
jgi:hypothetical protein